MGFSCHDSAGLYWALAGAAVEMGWGASRGFAMTQLQKRIHLLLWFLLGPLALLGLFLAVLWRPAEPIQVGPLPGLELQESAQRGQNP